MKTPDIETARLNLRAHTLQDFALCFAMWSDPLVTQFIGGKPSTEQQTWARMLAYRGHWELMGFGYWAIEERSSGRYIGELGFADFKRDITPSLMGIPELGWALRPSAQGKGFGSEAVEAVLGWGDTHLKSAETACIISPENLASIQIAEKNGFKTFQDTTYAGAATRMFKRTR